MRPVSGRFRGAALALSAPSAPSGIPGPHQPAVREADSAAHLLGRQHSIRSDQTLLPKVEKLRNLKTEESRVVLRGQREHPLLSVALPSPCAPSGPPACPGLPSAPPYALRAASPAGSTPASKHQACPCFSSLAVALGRLGLSRPIQPNPQLRTGDRCVSRRDSA